ncbi:MAG TPA: DNRLRE domain-containing protein [Candidatus Eisenbacteria bacterium]|nr:DNRLRE domain-containing protein [Candidatus Eisenbacteria bacterium]
MKSRSRTPREPFRKPFRYGATSRRILMALCGAACLTAVARAASIEIPAARDNSIFEEGDLANGAGDALFAGQTGSGFARRALIFFDVSGRLPAGARIDSVAITLQVTNAPDLMPRRFALHRLGAAWGESGSIATGGTGAAADMGDATWRDALYPGQRWSSPGGDFDPIASSMRTVEGLGSYTWRGVGLMADVSRWLADPGANHGWILCGEETGARTARRFASREAGESFSHPTMTIHYTPAAVTRTQSWGSVKADYR